MQLLRDLRIFLYERWHYSPFHWRYFLNKETTLRHHRNPLPVSSALAHAALKDLRRDGVATFRVDSLSGGRQLFERILAEEHAGVEKHICQINAKRKVLESGVQESFKDFLVRFTPGEGKATYDLASAQLGLHAELLGIVNGYFGLYSKLRQLEFWYTVAWSQQKATASQLWHRDHEDMRLIKVFLYLNDVDSESGPFSFVRGTHRGRLLWCNPDGVRGIRADDEKMAAMVPRDHWFVGKAPAGTVIMAATKGYHKGGLATKHDRRMLVMAYMSPWCKENYLPSGVTGVPVDAHLAVRFAAQQDMMVVKP